MHTFIFLNSRKEGFWRFYTRFSVEEFDHEQETKLFIEN